MNVNFDRLGKSVGRFVVENGGEFLGALTMAAVYSFCRNHGINMRAPSVFGYEPTPIKQSTELTLLPRNAKEAAIASVAKSALGTFSDFDKREAAEKIVELALPETDEDTRIFAISMLNSIANDTTSDYTKREINDKIVELAK